jgi:hypothetical protein
MAPKVFPNQPHSKIDEVLANICQKQSLTSSMSYHRLLCHIEYPNLIPSVKSKSYLTPKGRSVFLVKIASNQPLLKARRLVQNEDLFGYFQP